uniref:Uncharacterized protein n=1 Tax=Nelumbo nucifera TaxID=4432 RepID=A0A822ZTV5_NELNU|nr:TPA_asm: hypothetical protein HUJ06_003538 [Nelumbo nucifera]
MLKKMKRVVSMDLSPSPSPSYVVDEDARSRMRHQHLMQEYEELVKDVQAMKNNLQRAKERKLTLLAEVKFLRGRYKYLMKNQIPNPQQERNPVWIQNPEIRSEILSKERTYKQKEVAMKNPAPVLDLNQISF